MDSNNRQAALELGTQPVGVLLWRYALPAVIAMTAASLYNIIDRIFIGQIVGALAISGLAITFPFMNLGAAFGSALGVGAANVISVSLGKHEYEQAEHIFGNAVSLVIIVSLVYTVVCFVFLEPILRFFGASDATLPYARSFMQVILIGTPVSHLYYGLNNVLRAAAKPRTAMTATLLSVVLNIALDMVFIWWWHWGIRGAAIATVTAQTIVLMAQFHVFADQKSLLHLRRGIYGLRCRLIARIVSIGISPFLMNVAACVVVFFVNVRLVHYDGDLSVGAYGIANSIATMFIMFGFGLCQGMQPIVGYNYGARLYTRMMRCLRLTILVVVGILSTGWLVSMTIPHLLARLFTSDRDLIRLSSFAIRTVMLAFPLVGFQLVVTNFFQCIGRVKLSIFLSLSRQIIYLVPALAVLPLFRQVDGVWYAMPVSDVLASVTAFFVMAVYRKRNKIEYEKECSN
ncbi:MAG: MATE family efflux transporter [Prevotella sp.]